MKKETLNELKKAKFHAKEAINLINQEKDNEYKEKYLEILERNLTDLSFLVTHYDIALMIQENPEKAEKVIDI